MDLKQFLRKYSALMGLFACSFSSHAGLLTFNGAEVSALNLTGHYSSFAEFYDYNSSKRWSSNTGLEQNDTVILFTAELNDEFAIFATISKFGTGKAGGLFVSYVGSAGAMLFTNDPDDLVSPSGISYNYFKRRNDGFIYGDLDDSLWTFDLSLSEARNLSGVRYISFADGTLGNASASELLAIGTGFSITHTSANIVPDAKATVVDAPASLAISVLALSLMCMSRRKTA
ncbi:hypothetical protein [Paraglaciecola sp.]|uniref:hypothetical protein n=1 Tax=Paraglaciecola sp. TaxID=1920173 RepID=UPI00273F41E9|nr:hypothetical protein [Paraglaciecola sp.]MDP5030970.1 hypothetical protein [Paraglaciecola sp.]